MRPSPPLDAFFINLPGETGRRKLMLDQFALLENLKPRMVTGLEGSLLSDNACFLLTRHADWVVKGAISNFMSHVKAWEDLVQSGAPWGVVLEDDVDISRLDLVSDLDLSDDADLVFLGNRASVADSGSGAPIVVPLSYGLAEMDRKRSVLGSEAYLLSRLAASKLLEACKFDTYFGYVGGRLLRYSASEEDLASLGADSWLAGVMRDHHHYAFPPKFGLLKGFCLSHPIVYHLGLAPAGQHPPL